MTGGGKGEELEIADGEAIAEAERRAPVGCLPGRGVDRAGGDVLSTRFTVAPSRISAS
jgi:hypothetical protein